MVLSIFSRGTCLNGVEKSSTRLRNLVLARRNLKENFPKRLRRDFHAVWSSEVVFSRKTLGFSVILQEGPPRHPQGLPRRTQGFPDGLQGPPRRVPHEPRERSGGLRTLFLKVFGCPRACNVQKLWICKNSNFS